MLLPIQSVLSKKKSALRNLLIKRIIMKGEMVLLSAPQTYGAEPETKILMCEVLKSL